MLTENDINERFEEIVSASPPISGLIDREYDRLINAESKAMRSTFSTDSPVLNFFTGSVSSERLRHEVNVQHAGLAHWCHHTEVDFAPGAAAGDESNKVIPIGNRADRQEMDATLPPDYVAAQRKLQRGPAVTRNDIKLMTPAVMPIAVDMIEDENKYKLDAPPEIRDYRRPKSMTLTNLLAKAKALLKA